MVDVSKITYKSVILTPNGTALDADAVLQSLTWEDNAGELAQRVSAPYIDRAYGSTWLSSIAAPGAYIFIYADWGEGKKEVFRGPIWNYRHQEEIKTDLELTAYDNMIYLEKSKDYRWYAAGTSSKTILLDIFNAWGIPVGKYNGPNVALGKKVFKGKSIADMVLEVLDDAKKKGAGTFIVRSNQGKVEVVPRGSNSTVYKFEAGVNAESTEYSIDMGDLVTRVKIVGAEDKNERAPVEAIIDGKTEFGLLQEVIQRSQDDTLAAAKSAAQEILNERGTPKKTRKLKAPDLPFLRKGDKIYVKAGKFNGYYYVASVQHDATRREMTLEVEE